MRRCISSHCRMLLDCMFLVAVSSLCLLLLRYIDEIHPIAVAAFPVATPILKLQQHHHHVRTSSSLWLPLHPFKIGGASPSHFRRRMTTTTTTRSSPSAGSNEAVDKTDSLSSSVSSSNNNNNQQQEDLIEKSNRGIVIAFLRNVYLLIGSTTSHVVAGTFFIVLATRRDAFMVSFFLGAIANGVLSKVLKRFLNQQRPPSSESNNNNNTTNTVVSLLLTKKPSDNGMPSSHAMSLGFIGIFTIMCILQATLITTTTRWILLPSMVLYGLLSLVYRVDKQLHTPEQILVGLTIGSINGWIWYQLCTIPQQQHGFTLSIMIGSTSHHLMTIPSMVNYIQSFLSYWSPQDHRLPIPFLIIPAIVGACVVFSLERRIGALYKYYCNQHPSKTE